MDIFKQLLGINQHNTSSVPSSGSKAHTKEYILTPQVKQEISQPKQPKHRLKCIKDLCEVVQSKRLEENGTEVLWECTKDLLKSQTAHEDRQIMFRFLNSLIKGQFDQLEVMRDVFYRAIRDDINLADDAPYRFELFQTLTSNGKQLEFTEDDLGEFILQLMDSMMSSKRLPDFMSFLLSLIESSSMYLKEDALLGIVYNSCHIGLHCGPDSEVEMCLNLLNATLDRQCFPSRSLLQFITFNCQIVNREKLAQQSWQLMRKLLETPLGHTAICCMCHILQDKTNLTTIGASLKRGAIFFIGMALWGSKRVNSLKNSPSSVLPFFYKALTSSNAAIVTLEVILTVDRLVSKFGAELQPAAWDIVLDIATVVLRYTQVDTQCSPSVLKTCHDILSSSEMLYEKGNFHGSSDRLFEIIESVASQRPESSILCLITYRVKSITPTQMNWLENINALLDNYFTNSQLQSVRLRLLEMLSSIVSTSNEIYRDDLIKTIVLTHLANVDNEKDAAVLCKVLQLLVDLAESCESDVFYDLIDVLKKVLKSGSDISNTQLPNLAPLDKQKIISGLVHIFKIKLYKPQSSHAVYVFELLISQASQLQNNAQAVCRNQSTTNNILHCTDTGQLRKELITCLMDLRVDNMYHIGSVSADSPTVFSSYIICRPREAFMFRNGSQLGSPQSCNSSCITILPCEDALRAVCLFIEQETNWNVLKVVLEKLPPLLQNKNLVAASYPGDLEKILIRLCKLLNDRNIHERLSNTPSIFTKSDFQVFLFPVLTCLISYTFMLDRSRQMELVRNLEIGLVSRCSRICVRALAVCALEMRNAMMRHLPSILQKLSQISATTSMAIPLMEFLSSLIHLPELYCNFVEDEYKSVFAIALPYTNPFKYNHYTVSLAYHVIAMWFIKCRLPFRRNFVRYIVKGLKVNVLRQIEQDDSQRQRQATSLINQDSSLRSRAQSLNEEALRKKAHRPSYGASRVVAVDEPSATTTATSAMAAVPDQKVAAAFHKELLDTCIDMLSRYAHFTSASFPKRSPVAKFLLDGGQAQSWLMGDSIITVTTSGGARVGQSGLCEKCIGLVRSVAGSSYVDEKSAANRRRHKSEAVIKLDSTFAPLKPLLSQDDIGLHRHIQDSSTEVGSSGSVDAKKKAVDNVLIGLKPQQPSIFRAHVCNCWCTQWAELYVRRPTGNFSWMMHLQNEQDLLSMFPEFVLSDISNLFKPISEEDELSTVHGDMCAVTLGDIQSELNDCLLSSELTLPVGDGDGKLKLSSSSPEFVQDGTQASLVDLPGEGSAMGSIPVLQRANDRGPGRLAQRSDDLRPLVPLISGSSDSRTRGVLSSVSEESDQPFHVSTKQLSSGIKTTQGGVNPSFIFLQLFQNQCFRCHSDSDLADGLVPLPGTEETDKSITNLDFIAPFETHKIGVIYVKPGQTKNETAILGNMHGSPRYMDFIQKLGDVLRLSDVNPKATYVGGLDHRGTDGPFVYVWQAEFMQVVFHITTLMPCQPHDPQYIEKKKHIGNDYVTIVYNDSGEDYRMGIVKSQFNFVNIVIQPLDQQFNCVTVQTKPEIEDMIGHTDTKIISDSNLALLVRQMAVHSNLASTIYVKQKINPMNPYASNWLERLRLVRHMRERLTTERAKSEGPVEIRSMSTTPRPISGDDFSDFLK